MDMQTYTLWLLGTTALLVDDRTSAAQRQDVFDSVLYAQLQTEKHADTHCSNYPAWSGFYRDALASRGWAAVLRNGQYLYEGQLADTTPLQWLAGHLQAKYLQAPEALAAAVKMLEQQTSLPFDNPVEGAENRYAVYELGFLHPGPELLLCGLGMELRPSTVPPPPAEPSRAAELGNDYLSTWRGVLDDDTYEEMRDRVRREVASKLLIHDLIKDLGALPKGDTHGQA